MPIRQLTSQLKTKILVGLKSTHSCPKALETEMKPSGKLSMELNRLIDEALADENDWEDEFALSDEE